MAIMIKYNANKKNLTNLLLFFKENIKHGHSFRYYCGTSAHDEDYIEYDIYKFYYIADDVFNMEWFGYPVGKRNIATLNWEELIDWLKEMWD